MAALVAILVIAASIAAVTMSIVAVVRSAQTGTNSGGGTGSAFPVIDTVFDVVSSDSSLATSLRIDMSTRMMPNSTVVMVYESLQPFSTIIFPGFIALEDIVVLQELPQLVNHKSFANPTLAGTSPSVSGSFVNNLLMADAVNSGGFIQGDFTNLAVGQTWEIVLDFGVSYASSLTNPRTAVVNAAQQNVALGTVWWISNLSPLELRIQGQVIGSTPLTANGLLFSYLVM